MSDDRAERFVSSDFRGVTVVKAQDRGAALLANRVARKRRPASVAGERQAALGKGDIVHAVATAAGLTQEQAKGALEGALAAISVALKNGQEVRLVGFGTFSAAKRKAGTARNPRTGEPVAIKATTKPRFRAGKHLVDAVNKRD